MIIRSAKIVKALSIRGFGAMQCLERFTVELADKLASLRIS
jgi:hypothetical protein